MKIVAPATKNALLVVTISISIVVSTYAFQQRDTIPPSSPTTRSKRTENAPTQLSESLVNNNDDPVVTLPPPPLAESNPNDDVWRNMRDTLPVWVQNDIMRDTGFVGFAADFLTVLAVPSVISAFPQALPNFMALTDLPIWFRNQINSLFQQKDDKKNTASESQLDRENTFETIQYGGHPMQVAHLMTPLNSSKEKEEPNNNDNTKNNSSLVIFVHGGAWGSGKPWMYRLVARPLLQLGYSVAVLGYRTYPTTNVPGQVNDVKLGTQVLLERFPEFSDNNITLMGHSSGSHIGLLSLLDKSFLQKVPIHKFVSLSGVFDIQKHYDFETGRGLNEISPMKEACGNSETGFVQCSPTYLIGDFIAKHGSGVLPDSIFIHGALDDTVPYTSTQECTEKLYQGILGDNDDQQHSLVERQRFQTLIMPEVGHADTIIHFMMGGETRDIVLEWLSSGGSDVEKEEDPQPHLESQQIR